MLMNTILDSLADAEEAYTNASFSEAADEAKAVAYKVDKGVLLEMSDLDVIERALTLSVENCQELGIDHDDYSEALDWVTR